MLDIVLAVGPWAILLIGLGAASIYGWGYYRGTKDLPVLQEKLRKDQEELEYKTKDVILQTRILQDAQNDLRQREDALAQKRQQTIDAEVAQQLESERQRLESKSKELTNAYRSVAQNKTYLAGQKQELRAKIATFEKEKHAMIKSGVAQVVSVEREKIATELSSIERQKEELQSNKATFEQEKSALIEREARKLFSEYQKTLDHREQTLQKKIDFFEKSKSEALAAIPWLAKAFADLDAQKALFTAHRLETKQSPAFAAADKVREAGKARREAIYLAENYKLHLDYYLSLFPWLEDYLLLTPDEVASMSASAAADDTTKYDGYEAVKEWLSPDEYDTLSNTQKWQLALDRYNNRSKTNWQLGIEYERYVGYTYEQQGYRVRYTGATQGLEDMGRDLIAENSAECLIIQCKRWSREKTIHEKHIFQLYGTCVLQQLQQGQNKDVHGVFVTTTLLSDLAHDCAEYLHITVRENFPLGSYPQIKCNVSKTGEKIYHLPFDQQYDRTMLNPADGDCYAATVAEAEAKGFRRAFRWHGSS